MYEAEWGRKCGDDARSAEPSRLGRLAIGIVRVFHQLGGRDARLAASAGWPVGLELRSEREDGTQQTQHLPPEDPTSTAAVRCIAGHLARIPRTCVRTIVPLP